MISSPCVRLQRSQVFGERLRERPLVILMFHQSRLFLRFHKAGDVLVKLDCWGIHWSSLNSRSWNEYPDGHIWQLTREQSNWWSIGGEELKSVVATAHVISWLLQLLRRGRDHVRLSCRHVSGNGFPHPIGRQYLNRTYFDPISWFLFCNTSMQIHRKDPLFASLPQNLSSRTSLEPQKSLSVRNYKQIPKLKLHSVWILQNHIYELIN